MCAARIYNQRNHFGLCLRPLPLRFRAPALWRAAMGSGGDARAARVCVFFSVTAMTNVASFRLSSVRFTVNEPAPRITYV